MPPVVNPHHAKVLFVYRYLLFPTRHSYSCFNLERTQDVCRCPFRPLFCWSQVWCKRRECKGTQPFLILVAYHDLTIILISALFLIPRPPLILTLFPVISTSNYDYDTPHQHAPPGLPRSLNRASTVLRPRFRWAKTTTRWIPSLLPRIKRVSSWKARSTRSTTLRPNPPTPCTPGTPTPYQHRHRPCTRSSQSRR